MEKNPKCSPYDLRALEAWLQKLSGEGLELTGEWKEFREGEKREKKFYIEPAEESAEPSQSLRDSRALLGWEYVCPMEKNAFYVWRSVGESAAPPRPRELSGSWADKRLGQKQLSWWFWQFASCVSLLGVAVYLVIHRETPVWSLLTDGSAQSSLITLLLGIVCGFWATRREYRDLLRLRRAVRAGEYEQAVAQHTAWYEAMRWIPAVLAVLALFSFISFGGGETDMREQPFLAAEVLGGEAGERFSDARNTPLCDVTVVQEGTVADWNSRKNWYEYETQLEVYRPRFGLFAKSLTRELAQFFGMEEEKTADGIEAYYSAANGVQRVLLRDGGRVLCYRTGAPDDLRQHMDDFAVLAEAYR